MLTRLGETFGVEKAVFRPTGRERPDALKWPARGQVTFRAPVFRYLSNSSKGWPAEMKNVKVAERAINVLQKPSVSALGGRWKSRPALAHVMAG
jgi:hypothetical protein